MLVGAGCGCRRYQKGGTRTSRAVARALVVRDKCQADHAIDPQSPHSQRARMKEAREKRGLTDLEKTDCKTGKSIGRILLR